MGGSTIPVGGPYFDDLHIGDTFDAPGLTITDGHAAVHQAATGDRLRLPLDAELSRVVTGSARPLVHPSLVCDVAIGQSTVASQRVRANLFYRGLILQRPVYSGDTLRTRCEVTALKQNRNGTGLAVLHITTNNQDGDAVLDFWRCPMLPLRDPATTTKHTGTLPEISDEIDLAGAGMAVGGWDLDRFREQVGGSHFADVHTGTTFAVEGRDVVSAAPELARLTLNIAAVHVDADAAGGRRLVYGGHTIAIAAAHIVRALPNLVTIAAWRGCDHTGPVFEEDVLSTEVHVEAKHPLTLGGLVDLRAVVTASGGSGERGVLDWRLLGVMA